MRRVNGSVSTQPTHPSPVRGNRFQHGMCKMSVRLESLTDVLARIMLRNAAAAPGIRDQGLGGVVFLSAVTA